MGCSPSKGHNLAGAQSPFQRGRALLLGSRENGGDSLSDDGGSTGSSGLGETEREGAGGGERRSAAQPVLSQKETPATPQRKKPFQVEGTPRGVSLEKLGTQEIEIDMVSQERDTLEDASEEKQGKKAGRKPKKSKGTKQTRKNKERKASLIEAKVDFPDPLVKAHQAAYAFLNPSIAKYEVLLGLLDQAAQTQLSLQPMVTFLTLRYEEINRGLKEMAEEGEKLLKENGQHLAWPCPLKNLSSTPSKASSTAEPPPDLLQQLLQYTTQRMRLVGHSVGGIGDSALEEASEYFTSLSELLDEKLKTKRALEARLGQVLARIESAALRKPGPEDSALYSEDSGIGAESESLAGSERLRRESCGSTGTIRTIPSTPPGNGTTPIRQGSFRRRLTGKISPSVSLTSIDSTCTLTAREQRDTESLLGSASLDDGEGEEEEEEEDDDEEVSEGTGRKRSNSSPPDACQTPRRLPAKRIENPQNVEMTLKMREAISGRIHFLPSQHSSAKVKQANSYGNSAPHWMEEEDHQPKRPQTLAASRGTKKKTSVAKQRRSCSAESLRSKAEDPTLLELERTQKDLSQRMERMSVGGADGDARKAGPKRGGDGQLQGTQVPGSGRLSSSLDRNVSARPSQSKAALRRHSSGENRMATEEDERKKKEKKAGKGPLRATPPPSTPPMSSHQPSSLHRGRNSVKKLIDTFSQGVGDKQSQGSPRVLGPLKGVRKCGVPVIPGLERGEGALINGNNNSCQAESRASNRMEDLDLDDLPPPPPEVLMDTSFESAQEPPVGNGGEDVMKRGRSLLLQRTTVTQRLRASMQSVTVLPSRSNVRRGSVSVSPARPIRQDAVQSEADPESEEAASLYKQARKIIHLRHSAESPTDKPQSDSGPRKPSPTRAGLGLRRGGNGPSDTVPSAPYVNSQPPATPPSSRARMLPSTPSNSASQHRRLPSPTAFKQQATPPLTTSPPTTRKLPTPPPGQRRLPSPLQLRKSATPNSITSSYPFKAPSPPASPRVQRWTRDNSSEESPPQASSASRVFSNARSVFCPASASLFEAQPCPLPQPPQAWMPTGGCVLPRPWGEQTRGRLPMAMHGPRPFVRRSHSDRRPSVTVQHRTPNVSVAQICGSEPAISTQGLEDGPTREEDPWDSQSDLRAGNRSASHPDLCIVGQALQRE
ncbi:photoreceptor cilium actin regulator [Megalops cyprinoides]|uniref:photoreceptor cilium actin regulator n=1 Tax=Megalops cyprinoides TaxID=118141 RepID=UPI0018647B13|nr:photoreceptor cilium actin regulator [Megalops cyprinoides]